MGEASRGELILAKEVSPTFLFGKNKNKSMCVKPPSSFFTINDRLSDFTLVLQTHVYIFISVYFVQRIQ